MYDTIEFTVLQETNPEIDFINEIPQYLTSVISEGESRYGRFVTGYIENFRIKISPNRLKVEGGSIARYVNGDNQQGMTLKQTRTALEKLSGQIHLEMRKAKVSQIHIGRNIITMCPPDSYLPYLGDSSRYNRKEVDKGLYYTNSLRILAFYDKIKEQKARRQEILKPFRGKNLLRYELRFISHLERQLNLPTIDGETLCDEDFYISMGNLWKEQFLQIAKRSNEAAVIKPTAKTRGLLMAMAAMTLQNVGDSNLKRMIAEWQQQGLITKKQGQDHRKLIGEMVKVEMRNTGNDLIQELTKKIKEATRYFV